MKKCPSCGWQCPDTSVRCVNCKCSLIGVAPTVPEGQAARSQERRVGMHPLAIVGITVAMMFVICIIIVGNQNNKKKQLCLL